MSYIPKYFEWRKEYLKSAFMQRLKRGKAMFIVDELWLTTIDSTHEPIRKFLDGINKTIEVPLDNLQLPVPQSSLEPIFTTVNKCMDSYLSHEGHNYLSIQRPYLPTGKHEGTKWTKYIQHALQKQTLSSENKTIVAKQLSQLGMLWAEHKTHDVKLQISICTDPKAFSIIGDFNCDQSSCFGTSKGNQMEKFRVGVRKNSFVLFVHKEKTKIEDIFDNPNIHADSVIARCWGIYDPNSQIWNTCNFYPMPGVSSGDILIGIQKFFKELMGAKKLSQDADKFAVTGAYFNRHHRIRYYTGKSKPDKEYEVPVKLSLSASYLCSVCKLVGIAAQDQVTRLIDGERVCLYCMDNAKQNVCELTGQKTFGPLKTIVMGWNERKKKLDTLDISVKAFEKMARNCHRTGMDFHKDIMTTNGFGHHVAKLAEKIIKLGLNNEKTT